MPNWGWLLIGIGIGGAAVAAYVFHILYDISKRL